MFAKAVLDSFLQVSTCTYNNSHKETRTKIKDISDITYQRRYKQKMQRLHPKMQIGELLIQEEGYYQYRVIGRQHTSSVHKYWVG